MCFSPVALGVVAKCKHQSENPVLESSLPPRLVLSPSATAEREPFLEILPPRLVLSPRATAKREPFLEILLVVCLVKTTSPARMAKSHFEVLGKVGA